MGRTLKDFLFKHTGETAWVFGKGPSLDRFNLDDAGPLRCAINEVIQYIPDCPYGFACDSVIDWQDVYKPGHVLFQPRRVFGAGYKAADPDCERIFFDDAHGDDRILWTREQLANDGLAIKRGTLGSTLQILHIMGVSKIVAVGIDGGQQHAAREWRTRIRNEHFRDYNTIRAQFILGCHLLGIELEFPNLGGDYLPNGMKRVKILRNVLVKGFNHYAGEIVDLQPDDADILLAMGKAERWDGSFVEREIAAIETATAKPAMEETVATVKRTGKRGRR